MLNFNTICLTLIPPTPHRDILWYFATHHRCTVAGNPRVTWGYICVLLYFYDQIFRTLLLFPPCMQLYTPPPPIWPRNTLYNFATSPYPILNTYFLNDPSKNKLRGNYYANGSFDGVIGQLQRGEIDWSLSNYRVTPERMSAIDFSQPISYLPLRLVLQR